VLVPLDRVIALPCAVQERIRLSDASVCLAKQLSSLKARRFTVNGLKEVRAAKSHGLPGCRRSRAGDQPECFGVGRQARRDPLAQKYRGEEIGGANLDANFTRTLHRFCYGVRRDVHDVGPFEHRANRE